MTYRSRVAVWASAALIAGAPHVAGQSPSNPHNTAQSWSNPPVPLVQQLRRAIATPGQALLEPQSPAKALTRCIQLSASQSGLGQAETLAQARGTLLEQALAEAGRRGWPATLSRRAETQVCAQQSFVPLFGNGYDCPVRATFCAR